MRLVISLYILFKSTSTAIPYVQTVSPDIGEVPVSVYKLHCMRRDDSPYIKLKFSDDDRDLGFPALFDSGSHLSYSIIETSNASLATDISSQPNFTWVVGDPISRPAVDGEAYRLSSRSEFISEPGELCFGVDDRTFPYVGTISERIQIFNGATNNFTFSVPELLLVPPPGDGKRVLLGAALTSDFAFAVGVFALVPNLGLGYNMFIGAAAASRVEEFCKYSETSPPILWYPLSLNATRWTARGHLELSHDLYGDSFEFHDVELFFDTGASTALDASSQIIARVIEMMEAAGAQRLPDAGLVARFANCRPEIMTDLPVYRITVAGTEPLTAYFGPPRYIFFEEDRSECSLMMVNGEFDSPNQIIVSMVFMRLFVTIFDRTHHRMGFCIPDGEKLD